jgi:hypothetical protein
MDSRDSRGHGNHTNCHTQLIPPTTVKTGIHHHDCVAGRDAGRGALWLRLGCFRRLPLSPLDRSTPKATSSSSKTAAQSTLFVETISAGMFGRPVEISDHLRENRLLPNGMRIRQGAFRKGSKTRQYRGLRSRSGGGSPAEPRRPLHPSDSAGLGAACRTGGEAWSRELARAGRDPPELDRGSALAATGSRTRAWLARGIRTCRPCFIGRTVMFLRGPTPRYRFPCKGALCGRPAGPLLSRRDASGQTSRPITVGSSQVADGSYVKQMVIGTLLGSRSRW